MLLFVQGYVQKNTVKYVEKCFQFAVMKQLIEPQWVIFKYKNKLYNLLLNVSFLFIFVCIQNFDLVTNSV